MTGNRDPEFDSWAEEEAKKPELAKVLCGRSGAEVECLMGKFNLDLSLVARS